MDTPRTDRPVVPIQEQLIAVGAAEGVATGVLQVTTAGRPGSGAPVICAAHPSDDFGAGSAALLNEITGCDVVCVNMRGVGRSTAAEVAPENALAAMADDLEAIRRRLALPPWVFWGMSGGGWIGQHHAGRHPAGLAALVLESTCAGFRIRLADPVVPLAHARNLQRAIPGAELVEIEGAGHVPSAQRHPEVRQAFERFWRYRVDPQTLDT